MSQRVASIPRPLVRANQWTIVLSVVLSGLTGYYLILLVPLLAGLSGLLFDFNPVMRLARLFLRKPLQSYIPEEKAGQQFNQLLAVLFLSTALVGYLLNWQVLAYAASIMVSVAALVAICGFCVGCFIRYQWLRYRSKHS